ncbi:MAG: hypothetical protein ACE5R6_02900 [Candidatus Heimdallarchaeota archaeon]
MNKKGLNLLFLVLLLGVIGLPYTNDVAIDQRVARNVILLQSQDQSQIRSQLATVGDDMQWNRIYGGDDDDWASSVIETVDGGFIFTGATASFGKGINYDSWLVKTDAYGVIEWNQTYGSLGDDLTYSVIQTSDGGYALAGWTGIPMAGGDSWLVKTDAYGVMEWDQTYGNEWYTISKSIIQTADGGYMLAGYILSLETNNYDAWLMKTDANGDIQWKLTYGGPGTDKFFSVIQTDDSGYAFAGYTTSFGMGEEDFWLVKTDARGVVEWTQTYGDAGEEQAYGITQTTDGGFAIIGHTTSFDAVVSDVWLVNTDAHGVMKWNKLYGDSLLEWDKLYGGSSWDEAYSIIQTAEGGFILAGQTHSFEGHKDAWLVKLDTYGVMEWNKVVGGSEDDIANKVIQVTDGSYVLAGSTFSFGAGGRDAWLVKIGPPSIASSTRFIYNMAVFILFASFTIIRLWKKAPYIYGLIMLTAATIAILKLWKKRL